MINTFHPNKQTRVEFNKFQEKCVGDGKNYEERNKKLCNIVQKIVEAYKGRKQETRYSRRVSLDEIAKNDFNLNISRYMNTSFNIFQVRTKYVKNRK